jgi:anthranilate/para-aminobenzoate synthase component I
MIYLQAKAIDSGCVEPGDSLPGEDGVVTSRPLAGTRKRGADDASEDASWSGICGPMRRRRPST